MAPSIRPFVRPVASPTRERAPTGGYREHPPGTVLRAYVESFWSREREPADGLGDSIEHRVLPDGCVDVVLELAPGVPAAMVVGTMTRAVTIESPPSAQFIGVRFRPGAAGAFLALPAAELTDRRVPLDAIWRDAEEVVDAVCTPGDTLARVRAFERTLASRLRPADIGSRDHVAAAVRRITLAGGNLEIAALAESLGVTRQHLARTFTECVGVSPKMFARVVRLRRLVDRVRSTVDVEWSALAIELGYFDQSHLIDDFRSLAGVAPGRWLGSREEGRRDVVPFFQDHRPLRAYVDLGCARTASGVENLDMERTTNDVEQ